MNRYMEQVEVSVSDNGFVLISQSGGGDDVAIALHPDQVDTVIKWLQEAKEEAIKIKRNLKQ